MGVIESAKTIVRVKRLPFNCWVCYCSFKKEVWKMELHNGPLCSSIFQTSFSNEGARRTRANFLCFTKIWVKIGAFPNAPPRSKIWNNLSVDQKDQNWWGRQNRQSKQKFIKHVNCVFI